MDNTDSCIKFVRSCKSTRKVIMAMLSLLLAATVVLLCVTALPASAAEDLPAGSISEDGVAIETSEIQDGGVPLVKLEKSWSILDFILAALSFITSGLTFISLLRSRRQRDKNEDKLNAKQRHALKVRRDRLVSLKLAAILVGVISIIMFVVFEDTSLQVAWIDSWTLFFVMVFIAQMVLAGLQYLNGKALQLLFNPNAQGNPTNT